MQGIAKMVPSELNKASKRYKKVPPEGGWGFLVLLGLAIFLTFTLGALPSLALIFDELPADFGVKTGVAPMLMSCFFASFSCIGLVTNYFYKLMTVRAVAMTGAIVFVIGSVWSIFATSLTELVFSYGILEGAGFGLMISASYSTFNAYFVKRRITMMSVAQSLFGLGTMAYPKVVNYFMDKYGYRGFMALRAGLHCHVILGMLVMHPVEWHMKKVIREDELLVEEQGNQKNTSLNIRKDHEKQEVLIMSETARRIDTAATKTFSLKSLWKKVVDFLDLTLLKDPIYVNIALGISFALYSDTHFFIIQPTYLRKLNFDKSIISDIVFFGAAADLASRIFLAISSSWLRLKARHIYLIGASLTILARFAFLYVNDFLGIAIVTVTMGFLRTWIHVPLPLVFADFLPTERFASGYGLFMFIQGIMMFVFTSIVDKISDVVKDNMITFHCLTLAMSFCVIPWVVEIIWLKVKKN